MGQQPLFDLEDLLPDPFDRDPPAELPRCPDCGRRLLPDWPCHIHTIIPREEYL